MASLLSALSLVATIAGALPNADPVQHLQPRATVKPVVSGTPQVLGIVEDIRENRDSCTSTRVGNREFWTCRDSESYPGDPNGFFFSSTASWTNFNADGTPAVQNGNLTCTPENTQTYFQVPSDECPTAGGCSDGTRFAIWPDTRPLPVPGSGGSFKLYTFIRNAHINSNLGTVGGPAPPTSLYRSDYDGSGSASLPPVTLVNEHFYPNGSIAFGNYGFVVDPTGATAFLYGLGQSGTALAKVPINSIEDKTQYQYYHPSSNTWDKNAPVYTDTTASIPNAGTGQQGTFYHSTYFGSYVWIGSPSIGDNSIFQITTAPNPQGPWATPETFYTAPEGTNKNGLVAYSQQAHPGLSQNLGNGKDIYLTYTKVDQFFSTPLVHVQWQ